MRINLLEDLELPCDLLLSQGILSTLEVLQFRDLKVREWGHHKLIQLGIKLVICLFTSLSENFWVFDIRKLCLFFVKVLIEDHRVLKKVNFLCNLKETQ